MPPRLSSAVSILGLPAIAMSAAPVHAETLRDRIRERMAERMEDRIRKDMITGGRDIAYGTDPLQHLAFFDPASRGQDAVPLVVFIHGGGWKRGDLETATGNAKVAHYRQAGYAFASLDYRLVPKASVEEQASDVASALAWLVAHARELNIDPKRVVLMGHSAGAHLAALVGTDPAYLRAAGLTERALAGVIPIDGAAYDVPRQLKIGAPIMGETYTQAFGTDPTRQRALSPTLQSGAPNAPAFLILHVQRRDGIEQAQGLAQALRAGGTLVQVASFPGNGLRGHMEINRSLGDPDYPATAVVDAFLKERFAQ